MQQASVSARKVQPDVLPRSLPPRGLSRSVAAAYIGVSVALFDEMVKDGRMPKPKMFNSKPVWDIKAIDRSFDAIPEPNDKPDRWSALAL